MFLKFDAGGVSRGQPSRLLFAASWRIRFLHGFVICGESLDLEPKYARIVAHTLLDAASVVHP